MIAYVKPISQTPNNKVNFEKLYIEIKSSTVPVVSIDGFNRNIYVNCENELTEAEKTELDLIITAHDGADPLAFDPNIIAAREKTIRELNQLAIYSPRLDTIDTVNYLTSIDNYINAYVRSGVLDVIIAKIMEDAQNTTGDHFNYLHTVVNDAGNKTYEYFIGKLQGLI